MRGLFRPGLTILDGGWLELKKVSVLKKTFSSVFFVYKFSDIADERGTRGLSAPPLNLFLYPRGPTHIFY